MSKLAYAELQCTSNFSFLRGASHPEEIAMQAKNMGLAAIAVVGTIAFGLAFAALRGRVTRS